ncbi:MAG: hypothetical protein ABSF69_09715 [Polyangiaceae bacterium]|jgi:hypothetical protein
MKRTSSPERSVAAALVTDLEEMLMELKDALPDGDAGWLRPMAVLSAEIEYSALRGETVDAANLTDELRELSELLSGSARPADRTFTARYRLARRTSPEVARLHERVLAACRCSLPQPD